jgi:phospholipase C
MKPTSLTHLAASTVAVIACSACANKNLATIPHLDHVFVVMMENHSYGEILDNPNAPFLNQYAKAANLATNYFAVGHPSLPNYLELVGGSNFAATSDNYPNWHHGPSSPSLVNPIGGTGVDAATPADTGPFGVAIPAAQYNGISIVDQLAAAGKSWKSYQENLPSSGADKLNYADGSFSNLDNVDQSKVQKLYAVKHNPFAYFDSVQKTGLNNMVGFSGSHGLYADLASGKTPHFSFIAPNQCHDMHGAGGGSALCTADATTILAGDRAVAEIIGAIKNSPNWREGNNAIVVLWDENDFSATPNRVVTIVDTNYGVQGTSSATPYNHFSLLKTLEAGFGLRCLNHACDSNVNPMLDLFQPANRGR